MAPVAALKHNPELRGLYHRKRSQGKAPKQALIVVARKLLTIVYSLLRYQKRYFSLVNLIGCLSIRSFSRTILFSQLSGPPSGGMTSSTE